MNEDESAMLNKFNKQEKSTILILDRAVQQRFVSRTIDAIAERVEQKLMEDSRSDLTWEPVPLDTYKTRLPEVVRSSWVFAVRARANTGAERHPNSHQFMMSYRRTGDLQMWIEEDWMSNPLISDLKNPIEHRWVSVPPNVWHRAIGSEENWIVVSFHTAKADELIEERPDPDDAKHLYQRHYI